MHKKVSLTIVFICLTLLTTTALAQSVKEYSLANDSTHSIIDARVLSAPTANHAVVFFHERNQPVQQLGKQYIKSMVVNKRGKPGRRTVLAEGEWVIDSPAPPGSRWLRIVDIIWNSDREGFDLFFLMANIQHVPDEPKLHLLPLDSKGRPDGKMKKIDDYGGNLQFYYRFTETRKFLSGRDGKRLLMTMNQETNNVRLHLFNEHGNKVKVKDNVLNNSSNAHVKVPVALVHCGPDQFCLYSRYWDTATSHYIDIQLFDAKTLKRVGGGKSFTLESPAHYASFAGNSHLLFFSELLLPEEHYGAIFQTVGVKQEPTSPTTTLKYGSVLAVHPIAERTNSKAAFNMFTVLEGKRTHLDTIYLTRIDASGNIIGHKKKLFKANMATLTYQPWNYAVTETANGNAMLARYGKLYVRTPKKK